MGNSQPQVDCKDQYVESPATPPPPPERIPLLRPEDAWRKVEWSQEEYEKVMSHILEYEPDNLTNKVNILLLGQIGAGKSSFCNTLNYTIRGRMATKTAVGSGGQSISSKLRKHEFRNKAKETLKFRIWDTMGLEGQHEHEISNIPYLLDGNIQEDYVFNPQFPIVPTDLGFTAKPTFDNKMHVVCLVIEGDNFGFTTDDVFEELKKIRVLVNKRELPLMVLMTKVDVLDEDVSKDIKNVFRSRVVRDTAKALSGKFGIPISSIFPVKNYSGETELDFNANHLTLMALRQILERADDYFEDYIDRS